MNFRSEESSGASRLVEAMTWVNEIESAKSIADLKTAKSITGAKLQTNFEVLDSRIASGVRRSSTESSKEEFSFKKKLHRKKNMTTYSRSIHDGTKPLSR